MTRIGLQVVLKNDPCNIRHPEKPTTSSASPKGPGEHSEQIMGRPRPVPDYAS